MTVGLLPSLGDEQAMVVDAAVRFMEAERPISSVRKRAGADVAYRSTAADPGWFGMLAAEEHAGGSVSGNGVLDAAPFAAQRGARLQPGPFPGHSVVVDALSTARSGARARRARLPAEAHPKILAGDELVAQFFSDPDAGSDLAAVRTQAVRDGRRWILNGSKIWSSGAYYDDTGMCLARTDRDVPKHRGLTWFLVPTRARGVTIERIHQINGNSEFCQEYFSDVELTNDDVIGQVNDGWTVAQTMLLYERGAGVYRSSASPPRRPASPATCWSWRRPPGRWAIPARATCSRRSTWTISHGPRWVAG